MCSIYASLVVSRELLQRNIMEDVRKWMERRLSSVPGLLAIIVTDRQILMSDDLLIVHVFLKPPGHLLNIVDLLKGQRKILHRAFFSMCQLPLTGAGTMALLPSCNKQKSYLENRQQCNVVDAGVPQGSKHDPLLWLIYCNDIVNDTESREGVPVVRASTAECPETAVRSPFSGTEYTTDVP